MSKTSLEDCLLYIFPCSMIIQERWWDGEIIVSNKTKLLKKYAHPGSSFGVIDPLSFDKSSRRTNWIYIFITFRKSGKNVGGPTHLSSTKEKGLFCSMGISYEWRKRSRIYFIYSKGKFLEFIVALKGISMKVIDEGCCFWLQ